MALIPVPAAVIDDHEVACALRRAVGIINPVVDVLSRADPFGLKGRTHHLGAADGSIDKALDALAWVLNTADVPGTRAWEEMSLDDRTNWWVRRVGALDTVLVAFPGIFGAVADRLPIQDVLGFTNQAIVLCAVARECGVDDYGHQVRLLAAVMCNRDVGAELDGVDVEAAQEAEPTESSQGDAMPSAIVKALWRLAGVVRAVGGEIGKRPRPRRVFRYLGMLPAVGAVADYFGEYGALVRAAKAGRKWIEHQSVPVR
ncbi:hypothetical protein [Mycolicibacterium hodleri]|uniref:Uncharacterized protein n=1 Tax=Mycolicibacterium hodleri TaxID=49897 RepID=A0A502E778_9MYCO|nr:hypothetical protein [Mycolicibacterium hodleri]TPG33204.1 hypothetical protein EAH80_17680 [Mycolicibacterium hodleri]